MPPGPPVPATSATTVFDRKSFCNFMNHNGRAYRYQALELIRICRIFSMSSQTPDQAVDLQNVLKTCDEALRRAARTHKKRGHVCQTIEDAIKKLMEHEGAYHRNTGSTDSEDVKTRMKNAKDEDNSKENYNDIISQSSSDESGSVKFHILRTLHDKDPIIVEQALTGIKLSKKQLEAGKSSASEPKLPYILWFFCHYDSEKRLTLAENPQFYEGPHPNTYGPVSEIRPADNYEDTIYVLANNKRLVFLELGENLQVFDNVWKTNDTLIFKDVIGNIKGESIIGQSIPAAPSFWSRIIRMQPPKFQFEAAKNINDWKDAIRQLCDPDPPIGIHIGTNGHQVSVESTHSRPTTPVDYSESPKPTPQQPQQATPPPQQHPPQVQQHPPQVQQYPPQVQEPPPQSQCCCCCVQ